MKHLILIIWAILSMEVSAQETCSRIIDKAVPVDTARYKVTYSLKYKFHPDQVDAFNDTRIVQIGKHSVKDYRDIINHFLLSNSFPRSILFLEIENLFQNPKYGSSSVLNLVCQLNFTTNQMF